MLHSLPQGVIILPRAMEHRTTMAWFPCCALMLWFQSHSGQHGCHSIMMQAWHHGIMVQVWHHGIMVQVWHHSTMAWVWVHTVVLQCPLCSHASSTRFHWPWAHTYCLPDLVILVSTPRTHSSLVSPQCTPSPWPDASGAKKNAMGVEICTKVMHEYVSVHGMFSPPHLAVLICKIVSVSV